CVDGTTQKDPAGEARWRKRRILLPPRRTEGWIVVGILWDSSPTSRPESIFALLVALIFAELDRLAVLQSPDVHFGKRHGDPLSLRIDGDQRDDEIAVGEHVVHVDAERAAGQLHRSLEEGADLVMAVEIARERTVTGNVPGDGGIEHREDGRNVSLREVVV